MRVERITSIQPPLIVGILAFSALMAGCLGDAGSGPGPRGLDPGTKDLYPTHSLNVTNCQGGLAKILVPAEWVRPKLPQGFAPADLLSVWAVLGLQTLTCEKVAVDGDDIGGGSVTSLGVAVRPPPELRPAAGQVSELFFEVSTNLTPVKGWLERLGLKAKEGTLAEQLVPISSGQDLVAWTIQTDARTVYEIRGVGRNTVMSQSLGIRTFFWDGDKVRFSESRMNWAESVSDGPCKIAFDATSKLAEFSGGNPSPPCTLDETKRYGRIFDFAAIAE